MMDLFDYQQRAIESLRDGFRAGHRRQMLYMPTGAGKSVTALDMVCAAAAKYTRVAVLAERIALVSQFSRHLDRAGVAHGITQADHPRYRPHERVQVCSQQTLESRGWPDADLVIVDEAHQSRKQVSAWLERTTAKVVGLSATPFSKGLDKIYTNLVSPVTTNQLTERGRLVPMRVYAGTEFDMRGAKTTGSEWQAGEATQRGIPIIGNIVQEWIKAAHRFGYPRQYKTFLFSPTVDYGEMLVSQFNAMGYRFAQISYRDHDHAKRDALLAELNDMNSDLCGIISVDALGRGVDVPNLRCLDLCRPFRKSFASHIQFLGRGLRAAPGKTHCDVLDHVGNMLRFADDMAYLFEHGCTDLDDGRLKDRVHKDKTAKEKKDVLCVCGAVLMPWDKKCPSCGKERKRKLSEVENVPGELRAIDLAARRNKMTSREDKKAWYEAFRTWVHTQGHKPGQAAHLYKERFGVWPRFGDAGYGPVFPEAMGFIQHRQIAYRHRKRA